MTSTLTKTIALIFCVAAFGAPRLSGQTPEWQLFGGYSFARFSAEPGSVTLPGGVTEALQQNANGFEASIAQNVNSWFGAVADFGGYTANRTVEGVRLNGTAYPFLFGGQFMLQRGRLTLFARPMVGGIEARANYSGGQIPISEAKWAYSFGGGADIPISDLLSLRVDADYIRSHFPVTLTRDFQNNFRLSAGVVLRIGTAPH